VCVLVYVCMCVLVRIYCVSRSGSTPTLFSWLGPRVLLARHALPTIMLTTTSKQLHGFVTLFRLQHRQPFPQRRDLVLLVGEGRLGEHIIVPSV